MRYFLVIVILIISCNKEKQVNIEQLKTKKLTLIFDCIPKPIHISLVNSQNIGGVKYLNYIASYYDSSGICKYINPQRAPLNDTVNISFNGKKKEIYFEKIGLEGLSYIFKPGDSVYVKYIRGIPIISILNRAHKKYDYSFESLTLKGNNKHDLTSFERCFKRVPFPPFDLPKTKWENYFKKLNVEYSNRLLEELKTQQHFLDSLYATDLLSKDIYTYYKQKLTFINWSRLAKQTELPLDTFFKSNLDVFTISQRTHRPKRTSIKSIIQLGDSLLENKFYHDFISYQFLPNYFENKTTKYEFHLNKSGGYYYDWKAVFDSIQSSNLFSKKVKEYLMYTYLLKIIKDFPVQDASKYFLKFKKTINDSTYINLINTTYYLDTTDTKKVYLIDTFKQKTQLKDVLNKHKGKLVYVDFWASWCAPCRAAFPEAKKLHKDYSNKEVAFVYISIDRDFKKWKTASKEEGFLRSRNNLFAVNYPNALFYKQLNLKSIPRYLLYDQQGNLIHKNAPGPEGKEIRALLDKHWTKTAITHCKSGV